MAMLKDETIIWRMAYECVNKHLPCALAIVIEAVGSAPQRCGAKLLVLEDGSAMGTVGGGMVEAQAIEAAKECMNMRSSCVLIPHTSAVGEKQALHCGGRMSILIDGCLEKHSDAIRMLIETMDERGKGCLAVHMSFEGAELVNHMWVFIKPHMGDYLCIGDEGATGEGLCELLTVIRSAGENIARPYLERPLEGRWVYVEPIAPPLKLVVVGAGHVGKCVAQIGSLVGLEVIVIDDRAEFACEDNLPFADAIICDDIVNALNSLSIDERTFVVIVARSHELDERALEACLNTKAGYIGMMGSRLKVRRIFNSLLAKGIEERQLERVRAPVGMRIGAVTPMELAVSIIAEVIASYRGAL